MALLFLDSFDHYANAGDKYLSAGSSVTLAGRHNRGYTGSLRLALNPGSNRCIFGAAMKFGSTFNEFFKLYDQGGIGGLICTISTMNDGAIEIEMFGGPLARSAADVVRLSQWFYIEVDLTVQANDLGETYSWELPVVKVYVDGALVIDGALGPRIPTNTVPSAYGWTLIDIFSNVVATIDDLYVLDGSGPAPHNAPLGDVQIDVIRPNGIGASTGWTPVGAATNFGCVDDLTPDDETTKVIAATAGLSDLYQMEDINTSDGIIGAQILVSARRTEEGFATLAPLLRHAGTTTELVARNVSPTYFYRNRDCFITMPNGDPLTDANVNALQAGVRRIV